MANHDALLRSSIVMPDFDLDYPTIDHGKGAFLYDTKGKEYVDCAGGKAAVANIGHGREGIGELLRAQAGKITISPTHYFRSEELERYVSSLVAYAPAGFSKAWTVTSGTEAVENAMKLAHQYYQLKGDTKRYKVMGRWGSYHGNSIYTLDVGGMVLRRSNFSELMHNTSHTPAAYCYRCPFDLERSSCKMECVSGIEQKIMEEDPSTVAAVIFEPVVGAALGGVPAPEHYFQQVREICDKYGILLIVDEVMSGFGRTAYNFGINHWGVVPDIIAMGKGMGSGYYPLSGLLINEKVAGIFEANKQPFFGGHTYSCNPMGAVVGQYVLDCILEEKLAERSKEMGAYFIEQLRALKDRHEVIGDVRGIGLQMGIELVADRVTKKPLDPSMKASRRICNLALEKGLILYPGGGSAGENAGDHILIVPPLVIEKEQIDRAIAILDECLKVSAEVMQVA